MKIHSFIRKTLISLIVVISSFISFNAQQINDLNLKIAEILEHKNASVGVSILDQRGKEIAGINNKKRFPMQSVFKFHIGLAMLHEIDKGKYSLDQKILMNKDELLPGLYSPLRDKYPDGGLLPISEIIEFMVSLSDNPGCDKFLKMLGGPKVVEKFIKKHKIKNIAIKINEETMQNNWDLQFQNWTTPKAANDVLKVFYENKGRLLSDKSHDFIWKVMKETTTGQNRIKGKLPEGTIVAHKTGTSGVHKLTKKHAAVNDIGIVWLPDGRCFYISVFVTDSSEDNSTNEAIIADISRVAWDYFLNEK